MGRISHTWRLMGASWGILKQDKELLLFPVFSAACEFLVLASFAVPMFVAGVFETPEGAEPAQQILYAVLAFLFYFCNYFVIVFFNAGIVACACKRMAGGDPTVGDGLRAAFNRLPLIAGWALVAATVGMVLRMIEERSNTIGRIVAGLLGMAWSLVSFFVVPILVIERIGPIDAVKESSRLLQRTWGEQFIGHFSFGMLFGLLSLPLILLIFLGIFSQSAPILIACISLAVVGLVLLAITQSTLQTIFQAALYLYARDGIVPGGFDQDLLQGAVAPRG